MKMRTWLSLAAVLATGVAAGFDVENLNGSGTVKNEQLNLKNATVYNVSGTLTYDVSAQTGVSAWTVPAGGTCIINLKPGAVLTLKGGKADGRSPAGCGIEVPANATLYITGEGTLNAIGGWAGNGFAGGAAGAAELYARQFGTYDSEYAYGYAGVGGAGGAGGGGSAPGIGGAGGKGGKGGASNWNTDPKHQEGGRNQWEHWTWNSDKSPPLKGFEHWVLSGANGGAGGAGDAGGTMGNVYIVGYVKVNAQTINQGTPGAGGDYGKPEPMADIIKANNILFNDIKEEKDGRHSTVVIGRGGVGAGGAGGGAVTYGIGGGAGGGGGGGAGGEGGARVNCDDRDHVCGYSGHAGQGQSILGGQTKTHNGVAYADFGPASDGYKTDSSGKTTGFGGNGGAGGNSGLSGGHGNLYTTTTAILTTEPYRTPEKAGAQSVDHDVKITFQNNGERVLKFMSAMPSAPIPKNPGHIFRGWRIANTGVRVYNELGVALVDVCQMIDDTELEPIWEPGPQLGVVNTTQDGTDLGLDAEGRKIVTLRDAVLAFSTNAVMTGADGLRRITFDLPANADVIQLTNEIEVVAGAEPFEIYGLTAAGHAVTVTAKEKGAHRLFHLNSSVSFRSVNFVGGGNVTHGGAIRVEEANPSPALSLGDCSFRDNAATVSGGAVWAKGAGILAYNCTFAGNRSDQHSGAFYAGADSLFVNCTFSANAAQEKGGGIYMSGNAAVVNCTFAGNTASQGKSAVLNAGAFKAVNTVLADGADGVVKISDHAKEPEFVLTSQGEPSVFFTQGAVPVTNEIMGVVHVAYPPLPLQSAGLKDAAEVYYDGLLENVAYLKTGDQVATALYGDATKAQTRLGFDQVRAIRLTPTRGAIRLASGEERTVVNVEGRLGKSGGQWDANQTYDNATATIRYDDGETATRELTVPVKTDAGGYFAVAVEVDGSDGYSHNVTSLTVKVNADVTAADIAVTTVPYALVAASAELVTCEEAVAVAGKETSVNSLVSEQGVKAGRVKINGDFTAASVQGGGDIRLEGITLRGGELAWFANGKGKVCADLSNLSVMPFAEDGLESVSGTKEWTAEADGFVQVVFVSPDKQTAQNVKLEVGSCVVTPPGAAGGDGRTLHWTVPVRAGETVRFNADCGQCGHQFVPFGK